jgi:hypothetical protein
MNWNERPEHPTELGRRRSASKEGIALPTVDAVGLVHHPSGWTPSSEGGGSGRRSLAFTVALLFALVTLATGVLSLGAYCLTSDGGDGRALAAVRGSAGPSPAEGPSDAPAGAACPLPSAIEAAAKGDSSMSATSSSSAPRTRPVADRGSGHLETATFALG